MYVSVEYFWANVLSCWYGTASLAGSSRSALSLPSPASVQANAQNDPVAVFGGLLHIPSSATGVDWAAASEELDAQIARTRTVMAPLLMVVLVAVCHSSAE